jgi:hypothetical protein
MLISMPKRPAQMRFGHHGILAICITLCVSQPVVSDVRASDLPSGDAPRPRLQVEIPDPAEEAIRDLVTRTAEAVNNEDLDGVLEGIRRSKQAATRRRLGLLFATHAVAMDLEDQHVLAREATRAEVAVKYRLTLSGRSHDFVSIVVVSRVGDGGWVIDREEIQSSSQAVLPSGSGGCGEGVICFGGRCAVP